MSNTEYPFVDVDLPRYPCANHRESIEKCALIHATRNVQTEAKLAVVMGLVWGSLRLAPINNYLNTKFSTSVVIIVYSDDDGQ